MFIVHLLVLTPIMLQSAMCIASDRNHFASDKEQDATANELKDFANYVKNNAWQNKGKPNAKLKEGWNCQNWDMIRAASFIAAL